MVEIPLSIDEPQRIAPLAEHQAAEFVCAPVPGSRLALTIDGQVLEPFLRPSDARWRWRWNPGAAVGLHQAALTIDAAEASTQQNFVLRVAPHKINQERYETLLADVQRLAYNLAYSLSGAAAEGVTLQRDAPWERSALEEFYGLFEGHFAMFEQAVRRIASRPREQLRATQAKVPLGEAANLDGATLAGLARDSFDPAPAGMAEALQSALRPGGGVLPRNLPAVRSATSHDTYEHRLLVQVLGVLWRRARFLGRLAEREVARLDVNAALIGAPSRLARARQIAEGCAAATHALRELRGLPFLAGVPALTMFRGATPLLQRDPAYRAVYRMWQALRQHPFLAFETPLSAIPIVDLPRLYEAWCTLQVVQALLALGGQMHAQRLVHTSASSSDDELVTTVSLVEDAPLLVIVLGDAMLTLRYQPRYRPGKLKEAGKRKKEAGERQTVDGGQKIEGRLHSLDRYTHVPDLAIEVERDGARRVLVLDAKYRIDAEGRGVPPDALADAYTYLGAIGSAGARATLGAWLLYPGRAGPEHFASGVSTVPLLPGAPDELRALLRAALT